MAFRTSVKKLTGRAEGVGVCLTAYLATVSGGMETGGWMVRWIER
jgi:hypothetical protein